MACDIISQRHIWIVNILGKFGIKMVMAFKLYRQVSKYGRIDWVSASWSLCPGFKFRWEMDVFVLIFVLFRCCESITCNWTETSFYWILNRKKITIRKGVYIPQQEQVKRRHTGNILYWKSWNLENLFWFFEETLKISCINIAVIILDINILSCWNYPQFFWRKRKGGKKLIDDFYVIQWLEMVSTMGI